MTRGAQFLLLLLKNLKIKARNRGGTIIEALFPLICLALILGLYILFARGADADPNFSTMPIQSLVSTAKNKSLAYGPDITAIRDILTAAFGGRTDLLYPTNTEEEMEVILSQQRESLGIFAGKLTLTVSFAIFSISTGYTGADPVRIQNRKLTFSVFRTGVYFRLTEDEISSSNLTDTISYSIRFPGQFFPNPAILTQFTSNSNVSPNLRYLSFLSVQQHIDRAIAEMKIKEKLGLQLSLNFTGSVRRFPMQIGEADLDSRWQARNVIIKPVAGTWFTFCLLFTVYRLVSTIMVEKKTKVRNSMRMMGMRVSSFFPYLE